MEYRLHFRDTWQLCPRLTLNYGERDEGTIHRHDKPATTIFPIHAEARAMRAALPGERIVEVERASEIVGEPTAPELQTSPCNGDLLSAGAEAWGAILLRRGRLAGADVQVRKAEIIDQHRPEHAGYGQHGLVNPDLLPGLVRRVSKPCV